MVRKVQGSGGVQKNASPRLVRSLPRTIYAVTQVEKMRVKAEKKAFFLRKETANSLAWGKSWKKGVAMREEGREETQEKPMRAFMSQEFFAFIPRLRGAIEILASISILRTYDLIWTSQHPVEAGRSEIKLILQIRKLRFYTVNNWQGCSWIMKGPKYKMKELNLLIFQSQTFNIRPIYKRLQDLIQSLMCLMVSVVTVCDTILPVPIIVFLRWHWHRIPR